MNRIETNKNALTVSNKNAIKQYFQNKVESLMTFD